MTITHKLATRLAMVLILALALFLRLYNISWDNGYLFHPDERQILVVTEGISFPWPPDASLLLSPQSPLNPHFFAYGSLPIYLLRACASLAGLFNPALATLNDSSYIVGRVLSALFDLGSIYLLYRLGRKLYDPWVGVLAAALLALTVLHIQLSHFYAVDTVLAFLVLLTVTLAAGLAQRPTARRGLGVGVAWGMALATKVSAAPLFVPIALAWLLGTWAAQGKGEGGGKAIRAIQGMMITGLAALVTFVAFEPYALLDVVTFVVDVAHEGAMVRGVADVPYTRQFIGTLPYLYPIQQAITWSMGIPLGLAGFGAGIAALVQGLAVLLKGRWQRARQVTPGGALWMPLSWSITYFALTGSFHTKFLRYMLPIIPFLVLWAAWALLAAVRLTRRSYSNVRASRIAHFALRIVSHAALIVVLLGTGLYALAYLNIYAQTHPWIQATAWICQNLPRPSRILGEHWDDPLPLLQATGDLRCYRQHEVTEFAAYGPDDTRKLGELLRALEDNDYIILSSNRLYNAIPRLPRRYPLTSRYYQLLMGERLGYDLVYYAAVYPRLLGVDLRDDTFVDPVLPRPRLLAEGEAGGLHLSLGRADESYSVYDHPMPLVFRKTRQLSRQELLGLFGDAAQHLPPPGER